MMLLIDGRKVDLDDSVDRVVIEKSGFGAITVTSHMGVKKQMLSAPAVDHTAFRDAVRPINRNGVAHHYKKPEQVEQEKVQKAVRKAAGQVWLGKTCESCGKGEQGTRARNCKYCMAPFPPPKYKGTHS